MKNYTDRIEELIDRYRLEDGAKHGHPGMLMIGNTPFAKRDNVVSEIRDSKPQIFARLAEMEQRKAEELAAKEARAKLCKELTAQIEGLAEIKAAKKDLDAWHEEFEASFEDVGGMGVRPKPDFDINAMLAAYPRAAAYLKAEAKSYSANYELAAIGEKALDEVIFGDYISAMEAMEIEIDAYVKRHIWD